MELPGREKGLFLEALFSQLWVGLLLKIIPFRWIPRLFASPQPSALSQQSTVNSPQSSKPELIKRANQRASIASPWKNRCLVSSLAARCMLRRRKIGSHLSLGLAKDHNGMTIAHAWLKSGDFEIVEKSGDYTALYTFG